LVYHMAKVINNQGKPDWTFVMHPQKLGVMAGAWLVAMRLQTCLELDVGQISGMLAVVGHTSQILNINIDMSIVHQ